MSEKYCMSFTSGGVLLNESIVFSKKYLKTHDFKEVIEQIINNNFFQYRTESAIKRTVSELKTRFSYLNDEMIQIVSTGFQNEVAQILWFSICRKYQFIFEFVQEVIREKYILGQYELTNYDFDAFYNRKSINHPSLEKITDKSRYKLKQVLFKMLKDINLINDKHFITPIVPTARVLELIKQENPEYLGIFVN